MEVNNKEVGSRISKIRKELGLNQEQFGKKINNAHKSLVSKWEKGQGLPNNERLKLLADIGGISVNELLYGSFENRVINLITDYVNNTNSDAVTIMEQSKQLNNAMYTILNYILARKMYREMDDNKLSSIIERQINNEFMRGDRSNEKAISYISDYIATEVTLEVSEYFFMYDKEGKPILRKNMSKELYELLIEKIEAFSMELQDLEYDIFGDI